MRTLILASSLIALFVLGREARAEHDPAAAARAAAISGQSGQPVNNCDETSAATRIAPAPRPLPLVPRPLIPPPAPTPAPTPKVEDKADEGADIAKGDADKGALVYARCIECHKGQKPELQLDLLKHQDQIDAIDGKNGKALMPKGGKLTAQEKADIKAYIKSLEDKAEKK